MGRMTIEKALISIEKELKCRKVEPSYCSNSLTCEDCPAYVSHEDLTDTLQTLYDWIRAERRNE